MRVDAFLADSVASADGKLYVHGGGWNAIYTQNFPAQHPRIGIALIIHVPYTATNEQHSLRIKILDADGTPIRLGDDPARPGDLQSGLFELEGQFAIGRPPLLPPGDEQVVPLAMNLDGVVFASPNTYTVITEIDGTEVHRLGFRVALLNQAPPGVGGKRR